MEKDKIYYYPCQPLRNVDYQSMVELKDYCEFYKEYLDSAFNECAVQPLGGNFSFPDGTLINIAVLVRGIISQPWKE